MTRLAVISCLLLWLAGFAGCPESGSAGLIDSAVEDVRAGQCDLACPEPEKCDLLESCDCETPRGPDCSAEPGDFCAMWEEDLAQSNLESLRRFALFVATSVVEGEFGQTAKFQGDHYASLTVDKVHYGWSFLAGMTVWVRVPEQILDSLGKSAQWTVSLSSSHPSQWEQDADPAWSNAIAVIPEEETAGLSDLVTYRSHDTTHVAVVRIVEQDEYRTTFEVLDALKGTFPEKFSDNWYHSWNLPYPPVSDNEWVASVYGLTEYPEGQVVGSVYDFRPATPEKLALVKSVLAHPQVEFDSAQLQTARQRLHVGLRFHYSPTVLTSVITGRAEECCTGAGGTFIQHEITETLKGETDLSWFITGGHAYYGPEECGDRFVQGLGTLLDPSGIVDELFDCLEYPYADSWDAWGEPISSPLSVQLPASEENLADVASWLSSSPPLYQLHAPNADLGDSIPPQDAENALWSHPLDAATAFLYATHIAVFTIEQVTHSASLDAWEVLISTTFSVHEYDHLEVFFAKLAFRCGDARLLEEGARWIAPFVLDSSWSFASEKEPNYSRILMLPGVLIPEAQISDQLESKLSYFP